jgi:hypothetical protein
VVVVVVVVAVHFSGATGLYGSFSFPTLRGYGVFFVD